jgi:hypothetical protein
VKEERHLEAIPTAVPPSNLPPAMDIGFSGLAFLFFPPPLLRECLGGGGGGLYIVFFGQAHLSEIKTDGIRRSRSERGWRDPPCWACHLQLIGPLALYFSYFFMEII